MRGRATLFTARHGTARHGTARHGTARHILAFFNGSLLRKHDRQTSRPVQKSRTDRQALSTP